MLVVIVCFVVVLLVLRGGWWWFVILVPNLFTFGMALFGATRVSRGGSFRYPVAVRFLSARKRTVRSGGPS